MSKLNDDNQAFYKGLIALSKSSFPKECTTCNKVYQTAEDFIQETVRIQGLSGLKSSEDDDGAPVVELFRNCHCGSTLLDFFQERRNTEAHRELFGELLEGLCSKGFDRNIARRELVKVANGCSADLLEKLDLDLSDIAPKTS